MFIQFKKNPNKLMSCIICLIGGTEVRIWDVLAGKLLAKLTQNHKTVTALCLAKQGSAIVTASLDKHVKIYNVSTFQLSHDITYPSAVLSIDISVSILVCSK